jgi:uncharacterized membrane protein HdeD (DUF308 family)
MVNTAPFAPGGVLGPLHAKWGWIVALGFVYLVAGVVALGSLMAATVATVLVVGAMMIIAGVAEVIGAFQVRSWGKFFLWLVLGVLYIVSGFFAWDNPLLAASVLTLLLGASLTASGVVRIVLGIGMPSGSPWVWVVISGVVTLLLGLIILAHWPVNSLFILGAFLGIDLVIAGASWIALGFGLRSAA